MLSELPTYFESATAWRNDMQNNVLLTCIGILTLKYETLILIFIRAYSGKNFPLYVEVHEELTPQFFSLDYVNYARWMPVHARHIKSSPDSIKDVFENCSHQFISKTTNKFSAIPYDQGHEQENKIVKGSGGVIGLTEVPMLFDVGCFRDQR